jgi:regulator of sirC expression with transglutaminase-like and TPR domain
MDPADRFVELVKRPASEAHLDLMAALLGASFDDAADVGEVILGLDRLAEGCRADLASVLRMFSDGRLRGNTVDYGDPRNSYLHDVLDRKVGIPITLSVCAMEVGRRLGLAIHGIGLPGHFIIECDGVYADPFHGGATYSIDELEPEWQRITGLREPLDRRLIQPVSSRSVLLRMLNNLKNTFVAMDDPAPLRVLAKLRGAFPELEHERAEYARWLRHWN